METSIRSPRQLRLQHFDTSYKGWKLLLSGALRMDREAISILPIRDGNKKTARSIGNENLNFDTSYKGWKPTPYKPKSSLTEAFRYFL